MSVPTGLPYRVRVCCSHCRGTNVRRDAWAEFDEASQRWELGEIFDQGFCADCDGEVRLEEERLDPEKACCGNCRYFSPFDEPKKYPGVYRADGRCTVPRVDDKSHPIQAARNWCDRHTPDEKRSES